MYQAAYGYGPGNVAASAPFNPNGVPQQPHNPHHQQQPSQQQMMYNPQQQQYGGIAAASHQSPYGTPSPGMGGNAGAMGMMQNNGMAQMGGGHGTLHRERHPTLSSHLNFQPCHLRLPQPSTIITRSNHARTTPRIQQARLAGCLRVHTSCPIPCHVFLTHL